MKTYLGILLVLVGSFLWPASADLADIRPVVQCRLPADIMQVEFAHETWVYRLYEDGSVKKVVSARVVASRDEKAGAVTDRNGTLRSRNLAAPEGINPLGRTHQANQCIIDSAQNRDSIGK